MEIAKVILRDSEIPVQKGTVRLVEYEDELSVDDDERTIEVELNVHPTVAKFIDSIVDYRKEKVTLISEENQRITGLFNIHVGKAGILLTGDPSLVNGVSNIVAVPYEKNLLQGEKGHGIPLKMELEGKSKKRFVELLNGLVQGDFQDHANRQFISTLRDKIQNGVRLNTFDQYIKREIENYVLEVFT
ncbi:hypothetical protein [Rummeliibacillus sp. POC4]|uniref:hypothetical protein n=1 Tax=Rummeliibacillus sp. POC4 TaxID=2305899 RepID=UPI000E65ED0B|nr:hypothetical protein [Rummeliibacillus sp. POC4]RIJ66667.1 hypothetical protein D1606_05650 [Rummeliibacillus sp. POC4]